MTQVLCKHLQRLSTCSRPQNASISPSITSGTQQIKKNPPYFRKWGSFVVVLVHLSHFCSSETLSNPHRHTHSLFLILILYRHNSSISKKIILVFESVCWYMTERGGSCRKTPSVPQSPNIPLSIPSPSFYKTPHTYLHSLTCTYI